MLRRTHTHTHTVEALQELILFLHKVHLYLSIYNVLICDWSISIGNSIISNAITDKQARVSF